MRVFQLIGAALAGLVAGGLVVMAIEWISSRVYRMPADLDQNDFDQLSQWISTLPVGAFLFVLVAWACGTFLGTYVARRLAPDRRVWPGLIVWALLTIASISNLILIPHPLWFAIAGIAACLISGLLGLVLAAPAAYVSTCKRTIDAPIERVFKTLATIGEFRQAVPSIQKIVFLTDRQYGVGTRFRETRILNGKEATTELEVTELVENEYVRMVSDTGGTIWDTLFRVRQDGESVAMNMQMDARPHRFPARVITPMIMGMVERFIHQDMDAVKEYCEHSLEEND